MSLLILEEIHPGKFQAFTKFGKFVGWIIKNKIDYTARPSNGWKVAFFPTRPKAERYLIASIRKIK